MPPRDPAPHAGSARAADAARAAEWLRTLPAVRERCEALLALAEGGGLPDLTFHPERLSVAAGAVVAVIRRDYPDLDIPLHSRWRHFAAGGLDRMARLEAEWGGIDLFERARRRIDLAVVSVLLDAGAGERWRYLEPETGRELARSEGLAVASLHAFAAGAFSADPGQPARVDAGGLRALTAETLARHFQVTERNPLAGFPGRLALLHRLGEALAADRATFGEAGRPGHLVDALRAEAEAGRVPMARLWTLLMEGLSPVWPEGRVILAGRPLGDVWPHPALPDDGAGGRLVPFHKLTQWLAYSLLEPLAAGGLVLTGDDALTGLAEYRNGGLFVDTGVLVPGDPAAAGHPLDPGNPLVVAWRALTVALLDRLAAQVREALGAPGLSLGQVLQGGTWQAGREAAHRARAGGGPPIAVASDGTLF